MHCWEARLRVQDASNQNFWLYTSISYYDTAKFVLCFTVAHSSAKQSTVNSSMNARFHPIGARVEVYGAQS